MKLCRKIISVVLSIVMVLGMISIDANAAAEPAKVKSISVSNMPANTLVLKAKKSFKLKVKVTTTGKTSKKVTYKSTNEKVVKVSKSGRVKALKKGTAKVVIRSTADKTVKKTIKVVVGTPVSSVKPAKKTVTLYKGDKYKIKTTVSPTKASVKSLLYKSNKPSVAKVDSKGNVVAKKAGKAKITITAKDGSGKKAVVTIKVKNKVAVKKISVKETKITLKKGAKYKLQPTVSPTNATQKKLSFESTDKKVATVTSGGTITAKKKGTAKIVIRATDGSKVKKTVSVTVTDSSVEKPTEQPTEEPTEKPTEEPTEELEKDLSYDGYTLKWEDEFEEDQLNTEDWNYETHEPGWVNNELQEYVASDENVYLKDGNLVIKPIKNVAEDGTVSYTSGRINTQNKHDFTYGMFEVRAKVPEGQGFLPAFWMMPTNENLYGQWPRCGEIDIMEVLGNDTSKAYGTIHYGNPHKESQGSYQLSTGDYASEYHTFTCEWEPGSIKYYVDGVLFHTVNDWYTKTEGQGEVTYPAPFDQPFYMILNLAVGGNWPGNPDETTDIDNAAFVIDYVKAYQKDSYDENVEKPVKEVVLRDPDDNGNYVNNGDFSEAEDLTDEVNWKFLEALGGVGSAEISNGQIAVKTENAGTADYSIQLVQPDLPMAKGGTYQLSFDAYADAERTMIVDISAPDNGYIRYLNDTKTSLGTEKKTYSYEFTMTEGDDANGRLEFNLGNQGSTDTVYISNIKLVKTAQTEIKDDDTKTVLADGNYIYNGSFQEGTGRMGYWDVTSNCNAVASVTGLSDGRRLQAEVTDAQAKEDFILSQDGLAVTEGKKYVLSFDAQADANKELVVSLCGKTYIAQLTKDAKTYSFKLDTTEGLTDKKIAFYLGINGTTYLDNIRLVEDSLIKNGDFSAGLAGFEVYAYNTSDVSYVVDSLTEDNAFDISIENSGNQDWHIQLKQNNVELEAGKWYTLKFDAKSSVERKIMYALQRDGSKYKNADGSEDWTPYAQDKVMLTNEYQTITKTFQMKYDTDLETILSISMGAIDGKQVDEKHRICIDNISLEETTEPEQPDIPAVEVGTELLKNGDFSEGETNWIKVVGGTGAADVTYPDNTAVFDITNPGDEDWNVQFKQEGIALEEGCTYKMTLNVNATVARTININFMSTTYTWYGGSLSELQEGDNLIEFEFTMTEATDLEAGLFISMGKMDGVDTPASKLTLSGLSLVKTK